MTSPFRDCPYCALLMLSPHMMLLATFAESPQIRLRPETVQSPQMRLVPQMILVPLSKTLFPQTRLFPQIKLLPQIRLLPRSDKLADLLELLNVTVGDCALPVAGSLLASASLVSK